MPDSGSCRLPATDSSLPLGLGDEQPEPGRKNSPRLGSEFSCSRCTNGIRAAMITPGGHTEHRQGRSGTSFGRASFAADAALRRALGSPESRSASRPSGSGRGARRKRPRRAGSGDAEDGVAEAHGFRGEGGPIRRGQCDLRALITMTTSPSTGIEGGELGRGFLVQYDGERGGDSSRVIFGVPAISVLRRRTRTGRGRCSPASNVPGLPFRVRSFADRSVCPS